jgi:hypothetical protein
MEHADEVFRVEVLQAERLNCLDVGQGLSLCRIEHGHDIRGDLLIFVRAANN